MEDGITNAIEADQGRVEKRFVRTSLSTLLVRLLDLPALRWRDHSPERRREREEQARELIDQMPAIHAADRNRLEMEEIDGDTLETVIEDPEEADDVAGDVAAFIEELEQQDISMLDSRTSNFIIDDQLHRVDAEFMDASQARRVDEITLLATVFHAPRRGAQTFLRSYQATRSRTPPLVYTMAAITGLCFALMVERSPRQASRTIQNYLSLIL